MSYTSLWVIDKNWSGKEYSEYQNSWLFPPVVWDILMSKYISQKERTNRFDKSKTDTSYMIWCGFFNQERNERHSMLNERINNSEIQYDRVLWELSNLSVFNAKDKEFVADCIEKFVTNNFTYYVHKDCDDVKDRFREVAKDIKNLPKRCKYFVIHPTSCDDNVEYWFNHKKLSSWDKFVCEFTLIENDKVIGFSDNLQICKGGVADTPTEKGGVQE